MKKFLMAATLFFLLVGIITTWAISADVPRITKEKLKEMEGNPDLILIDVRSDNDWKESDLKITGANREDPKTLGSWAQKYPKDKTIVLY